MQTQAYPGKSGAMISTPSLREQKMFKSKKTMIRVGVLSAAALVVFGAPAAFAASSYNVTAGSAPAGTAVGYTATTTGASPQVTFRDTTSGVVRNCASASAAGTVTVGTILSGTGIGTVDGAGTVWGTCTGAGGLTFTVTSSGIWSLDATGDTVGGVTPVSISGVNLHVSGSGCDFDVTGSVDGTYTNGTSYGTLTLPGTTSGLTISNVSGGLACVFVGAQNGDSASLQATYQVAADIGAYNPIQITSNP